MINLPQIVSQALRMVGARPDGDPHAMDVLAKRCRDHAASVREERNRVKSGHAQLQFEGPAADRLRHRIDATLARLERDAHDLDNLAAHLSGAASRLVADQHAHEVRFQRARAALVEQAERAARALRP